jgi:hypothetical protein
MMRAESISVPAQSQEANMPTPTEKQIAFAVTIQNRVMTYLYAEDAVKNEKWQRVVDYLNSRPPEQYPFFWIDNLKLCRNARDVVAIVGARLRIIDAFNDIDAAIEAAFAKKDHRLIADMINAIDRKIVSIPAPQATRQRLYNALKELCK